MVIVDAVIPVRRITLDRRRRLGIGSIASF